MAHVWRLVKMRQKRLSSAAIGIIGGGTDISGLETAAPEYYFDRSGPKFGWLGAAIVSFGVNLYLVLYHSLSHSVGNSLYNNIQKSIFRVYNNTI